MPCVLISFFVCFALVLNCELASVFCRFLVLIIDSLGRSILFTITAIYLFVCLFLGILMVAFKISMKYVFSKTNMVQGMNRSCMKYLDSLILATMWVIDAEGLIQLEINSKDKWQGHRCPWAFVINSYIISKSMSQPINNFRWEQRWAQTQSSGGHSVA